MRSILEVLDADGQVGLDFVAEHRRVDQCAKTRDHARFDERLRATLAG